MSMLIKEDRKDLVWAMRTSLLESVRSGILTEGKKAAAENFIINEATYEQLLNLAFNPQRDTEYKSTQVLEKVALETYSTILENEQADEQKLEKKEEELEKKLEKKEKKEEEMEEKKEEEMEKKEEKKEKEMEKKEAMKESFFGMVEEAAKAKGAAHKTSGKDIANAIKGKANKTTTGKPAVARAVAKPEHIKDAKTALKKASKGLTGKQKAALVAAGVALTGAAAAAALYHRRNKKTA